MQKICMNEITTMHATFEEDITAYQMAGFDAVEIALWKVRDYLQQHPLVELKQLLQKSSIRPLSACSKNAAYQCFGDAETKRKSIKSMEEDFLLMRELGCEIYIMGSNAPEKPNLDMYAEYISHLVELAGIAKKYNVRLAIEFNYCKPVNSIRTVVDILRKANQPNLGFVFDTCHFYKSPSKIEDIKLLKKEEIFLVHVTDVENVPAEIMTDMNRVIPGDGVIPLKDQFHSILELGYSGYYSVEIFNASLWAGSPVTVSQMIYDRMKSL